MWIAGVALIAALSALITSLVHRRHRPPDLPQPWEIARMAAPYPGVIGPLAGLTIASSVFLITLGARGPSEVFEEVIGGLFLGFFGFVVAAFTYSTTAGASREDDHHPASQETAKVLYVFSNVFFYSSIAGTWIVLGPMLVYLNLPGLGHTLSWLALFAVIAGAAWQATWLSNFHLAGRHSPFYMPFVGLTLATFYSLALAANFPNLWPAEQPIFTIGLFSFGFGALGFLWLIILITLRPNEDAYTVVLQATRKYLPGYVQAVITIAALQWFASLSS